MCAYVYMKKTWDSDIIILLFKRINICHVFTSSMKNILRDYEKSGKIEIFFCLTSIMNSNKLEIDDNRFGAIVYGK